MGRIQRILVISYSQTKQLDEIIDNFISSLNGVDIDRIQYTPKIPYPFPWTEKDFYQEMPESVLEIGVELNEIQYKYQKYDLVVLGYQPWFLSPSIPTTSLLQNKDFLEKLKDTPVITIIGSRNMWLNSQDSVRKRIKEAHGYLIGNIPFTDRHQNQLSGITILHWMLTGRKTRKYNIFPLPGISDEDIKSAAQYGTILQKSIHEGSLDNIQEKFLSLGKIHLGTNVLFIESKAKRIFMVWANLIKKYGKTDVKRNILLHLFRFYLIVALFFVAPIVVGLYLLIIAPLKQTFINNKKEYLCTENNK